MILFEGKLLPDEELDSVLDRLWDFCVTTIEKRVDITEKVILACGRIAKRVKAGEYDAILQPLLGKGTFTPQQMEEAVSLFDEDKLRLKYDVELGQMKASEKVVPLGILFHIAAGNAEGLPFYSVLE